MRLYILLLILISPTTHAQLLVEPSASTGFVAEPTATESTANPNFAPAGPNAGYAPGTRPGDVPVIIGYVPTMPVMAVPPIPPAPAMNFPFSSMFGSPSSNSYTQPLPVNRTEAGFSSGGYCSDGTCGNSIVNSGANASGINDAANQVQVAPNACMQKILTAARHEAFCWINQGNGCAEKPSTAADYQQSTFKGNCARAVASALTRAGINDGSKLGNAKDMGARLLQLGFENDKSQYATPADAPIGSILVYGAATRPGCKGLGSTYGHVEIKDIGGQCISDGEARSNIQTRLGADCRPLIGVYVPKSVKNCG